ncbi:MAG: hypothetical protein PUB21_08055 [Bacteroidales bacterium]|nr:hypothetical protein [Bacteroidales bacterium]
MATYVNGVPVVRRVMFPKVDVNGIPVIESTGILETASVGVDYGINPCVWRALPTRGVVVWKVRHPITAAGSSLPVNIVVPAHTSNTTVASENALVGTTKLPILDNKSTQVVGSDVTVPQGTTAPSGQVQAGYTTEHWVYIDKCCGIFRLMGVTTQATTATANSNTEANDAKSTAKSLK